MIDIKVIENEIKIIGDLIIPNIADAKRIFEKCKLENTEYIVDLSKLGSIDSAGVVFIDEMKAEAKSLNIIFRFQNIPDLINESIATFSSEEIPDAKPPEAENFFEHIGGTIIEKLQAFGKGIFLTSEIFYHSIVGIVSNKDQRKGTFLQQSLYIGVDALPIVALLSLIIGVILALQAAAQLRQFGANIFVADLIAVSMVREMGPMMTAIIIAGRSGSAIASEIATMKVTEELDALRMMAINPIRYVVVPKFHAISLCMPLLVVFSIVIGILGGLIIAMSYLDLSAYSYMDAVFNILDVKDMVISLSKSLFFSWLIVIIGSFYGFQVEGGAEGVGKATTFSVVASIFSIIVFDALFSLAFLPK